MSFAVAVLAVPAKNIFAGQAGCRLQSHSVACLFKGLSCSAIDFSFVGLYFSTGQEIIILAGRRVDSQKTKDFFLINANDGNSLPLSRMWRACHRNLISLESPSQLAIGTLDKLSCCADSIQSRRACHRISLDAIRVGGCVFAFSD